MIEESEQEETKSVSEDVTFFDQPEILQFVFYPRRDFAPLPSVPNITVHSIPVEEGIFISCRFYSDSERPPNILFFHGNGEIASDYDDIGLLYTQLGINFFVADYRGYGHSNGRPTISNMMRDAHPIFKGFKQTLQERGYSGSLFLMGRSLGSASAVELAYHYQDQIKGLIIESGFSDIAGLLTNLGIPMRSPGPSRMSLLSNLERVRSISIPTLVIHAEYDFLIPLQHGKDLYQNSAAQDKQLLIIPNATHNDIFLVGIDRYLKAVKEFVSVHS